MSFKRIYNKVLNKKNIVFFLFIISIIMHLNGYRTDNFNKILLSNYALVLASFLILEFSDFAFVFFIINVSVFLLNRPLIDLIKGIYWWQEFSVEYLRSGLSQVYISVLTIILVYLYLKRKKSNGYNLNLFNKRISNNCQLDNNSLRIMYYIYAITFIFNLLLGIEQVIFMRGKMYQEFYLTYKSSLPLVFQQIAKMNFYILVGILATKPSKKQSYYLLVSFIISYVPSLIIGRRGGFVLASLFSLIYFSSRHVEDAETIWIDSFEKKLIIFGGIISLLAMVAINELRHGAGFKFNGLVNTIITFFYKQGVSYRTHILGVTNVEAIRNLTGSKNYVFGQFTGPLLHNGLAYKLFGTPLISGGNSIDKAINGYWYSHILSYVAHPMYLEGFGLGTSYITELHHNYGYLGIIIGNSMLALVFYKIKNTWHYPYLYRYLLLIMTYSIIYLPRQPFSSFFDFLIKPYFIISVMVILVLLFKNEILEFIQNNIVK